MQNNAGASSSDDDKLVCKSAILKSFEMVPSESSISIEFLQHGHPKFGNIRMIAEMANNAQSTFGDDFEDEDDIPHNSNPEMQDDNDDPDDQNVLSLRIGLQHGGKDVVIKCEGPIVSNLADEAVGMNSSKDTESTLEGAENDLEAEDDDEFYQTKAFGPVSVRAAASPDEVATFDEMRHVCLYPDDLTDEQNESLQNVLEEVGVTEATVNEIADLLLRHEDALVDRQKSQLAALLG